MVLRVPLSKPYLKRTLGQLYGFTQATPKSLLLDPAWDRSVAIYPGMCAMKTAGDKVTLINGTGVPYGLFGLFIGGEGIDEPLDSGINACPVWVLGPDAEMSVTAPAFDSTATWTDPGNGTFLLVHAVTTGSKRGQLCPAGASNASAEPVAKLLRVDSTTKIVIGGLAAIDPVDAT